MNIAEKLKKLREEKGLSQQQLIDRLYKEQGEKIAISSIRNYENDKSPRVPQGTILLALSRFYDVSLEYLLDDEVLAKKSENLLISKELGLSDQSISRIKDEYNRELLNEINFLLSRDDFYFCLKDFKILKNLKALFEYTKFELILRMNFLGDKRVFYRRFDNEKSLKKMFFETEYLRFQKFDFKDIDFDNDYKYCEIKLEDILNYIRDYEKKLKLLQDYIDKLEEKIDMDFYTVFKGINKVYGVVNSYNIIEVDEEEYSLMLYEAINGLLFDYHEYIERGLSRNINYYFFNIKEEMEFIFKSKLDEKEYKNIINNIEKK